METSEAATGVVSFASPSLAPFARDLDLDLDLFANGLDANVFDDEELRRLMDAGTHDMGEIDQAVFGK